MDKYKLIDSIISSIDSIVDLRGAEKCRAVLDAIGKLVALKKGLADDDAAQERELEALRRQIEAYEESVGEKDSEAPRGITSGYTADMGKEV